MAGWPAQHHACERKEYEYEYHQPGRGSRLHCIFVGLSFGVALYWLRPGKGSVTLTAGSKPCPREKTSACPPGYTVLPPAASTSAKLVSSNGRKCTASVAPAATVTRPSCRSTGWTPLRGDWKILRFSCFLLQKNAKHFPKKLGWRPRIAPSGGRWVGFP
eukprot:COSAG04_NODE_3226_length_3027_cov_2.222678_3_plen_160_part_00